MSSLSRIFLSLLVACLSLTINGSQASSIRIAAPPIDNLLEQDGSGVYQRLVSTALGSMDVKVQTLFYPYRRAIRAFDSNEVDCIYSMDDVLYQTYQPGQLVSSYPLGKFSFHAFTELDKPAIASLDELANMRIVGIMGHELYLESVLQASARTEMVMTERQAANMLHKGRVDVLIAALPDIQPFISQLAYTPSLSLFAGYDRLNCHNTEDNLIFIRDLSRQLNMLKNNGGYERLAGEFFVPF